MKIDLIFSDYFFTELFAENIYSFVKGNSIPSIYNLESDVLSFAPLNYPVEIMHVTIKNNGADTKITPTAAIPLFARSADNIRDHRHVTSLLHRIYVKDNGIYVKPTLSFDERGHQKNNITYFYNLFK